MRQRGQLRAVDALEIGDGAHVDGDDVVVAAGHEERPQHRRALGQGLLKRLERILGLAFQRDPNDHGCRKAQTLKRQHRLVADDDAGILQRALAAGTGRRRQTDTRGKLGVADAAVLREFAENREVDPVELRYLEDGVVYVRIAAFQERTAALLREALDEAVVRLRRKGGVQGLLLDLRDNGGGLLREAVLVSDEFLNSGVILTTRGRSGDLIREFEARRGGTRPKWPIVILINAQTASAAEIVAGALSDQDRAVLVGTRTFGKGSVQNLFELPDGSALKLTIALYYTPSGRSIQAEGISPDVVAEQPAEDGEPFAVREEELDRHLRARPVAEASRASRRAAALRMPTGPSSPSLAGDLQAELGYQVLQELIRQ